MTQENMIIITARMLNADDELLTITTEAIPESQFESVVNHFELRAKRNGQEVHGVAVRKCADPSVDQMDFANYWNALKLDREIPFGKKLSHLIRHYNTVNTILLETERLRNVVKRYTFEFKQRKQSLKGLNP